MNNNPVLVPIELVKELWCVIKELRDNALLNQSYYADLLDKMSKASMDAWIPSLSEIHEDHDCKPGPCQCICGCETELGCTTILGSLCSRCHIAYVRGDYTHRLSDNSALLEKQASV